MTGQSVISLTETELTDFTQQYIITNKLQNSIVYVGFQNWTSLSHKFDITKLLSLLLSYNKTNLEFEHVKLNTYQYLISFVLVTPPFVLPTILSITYRKNSGTLNLYMYASSITGCKEHFTTVIVPQISKLLEPYTKTTEEDNLVRLVYTLFGMEGPATFTRDLVCPSWDEIKFNYPNIESKLNKILSLERPDEIGKFIFWHGIPGGGKTFAIRAALRNWKNKATFYYITDPENFFNQLTYMYNILLEDRDNEYSDFESYLLEEDFRPSSPETKNQKFKLFIIEDGLDFLLSKNRETRGAAISRFLNLTDGILGQGIRLLFIVTSNEQIENIDPAFLRRGRCIQELEFIPHSHSQAIQWAQANDVDVSKLPNKDKISLSDLYALKFGVDDSLSFRKERRIGI